MHLGSPYPGSKPMKKPKKDPIREKNPLLNTILPGTGASLVVNFSEASPSGGGNSERSFNDHCR